MEGKGSMNKWQIKKVRGITGGKKYRAKEQGSNANRRKVAERLM